MLGSGYHESAGKQSKGASPRSTSAHLSDVLLAGRVPEVDLEQQGGAQMDTWKELRACIPGGPPTLDVTALIGQSKHSAWRYSTVLAVRTSESLS